MLDDRLQQRLTDAADEFRELEARLAAPETHADPNALRTVSQRYRQLEPLMAIAATRRERSADLETARELAELATEAERTELTEEVRAAQHDLVELDRRVRELLIPPDPHDGRDVLIEIRGAEGGEEANLFARDLRDMYASYAQRHRWRVDSLHTDPSDLGGINQVTMLIAGDDAWRRLKFEGGPHRVQRVPVTESQGRVHTSSATVVVMPDVDEVDVDIDERDLDIDVYRSSGAGGQHVNTTDSAVRITHRPSGVVVTMQDERSQLQNRNRAMQVLRARLHELAEREQQAELSAERRSQVGAGGRSEKIRTYNFKENRVTDHRIGHTVYRLADVLGGDLDLVIDALRDDERGRLLAALES